VTAYLSDFRMLLRVLKDCNDEQLDQVERAVQEVRRGRGRYR